MRKKDWFKVFGVFLSFILISFVAYAEDEIPGLNKYKIDTTKSAIISQLKEAGINDFNVDDIVGDIKVNFKEKKYNKDLDKIASVIAKKMIANYKKKHRKFNPDKTNVLFAVIILVAAVLYFIRAAMKGQELFIRPIAGLQAIDEAVGRATEMGRQVMFVPGIYDMDDLPTIAGISILGHVAKKTAEYETDITVPVAAPIVFSNAKEVIKEAHLKVGRPDTYNENSVQYIANDQFGYAAGVCGRMVREKPATIFYMGTFYAESLLLAETGHHVNAIQIAGTTQSSQLPFFVAACDYTIIGEELFAASAYFSREPTQLGSLKGQDMGKLLAMISIIIGAIMASLASYTGNAWFNYFVELFKIKS